MPRTLCTARGTYALSGDLVTPAERAALMAETLPPELLHRCRLGRAEYDWRATAIVGRFVCRGCGISGQCGACAEIAGQRVPPGVVPALCALHGGLLEIGIDAVALAVDVPSAVVPRSRSPRSPQTQLTLLTANRAEHSRKEGVERGEIVSGAAAR